MASMKTDVPHLKLFLDSNVYIAGLASDTGASSAILYAAEAGAFTIYTTPIIAEEVERTLLTKCSSRPLWKIFRELLRSVHPANIEIKREDIKAVLPFVNDPDDAPILAAAVKAMPDYLITLDKKAFKNHLLEKKFPFNVVRPDEFMTLFREMLGE